MSIATVLPRTACRGTIRATYSSQESCEKSQWWRRDNKKEG
jgi:hypothetical protein